MAYFIPDHLETLKTCQESPHWKGRNPRAWARSVAISIQEELPEASQYRDEVFLFCRDEKNSAMACVATIMAWGAMRTKHGEAFFGHADHWEPVVFELRGGSLSRTQAYDRFAELRRNGNLPHCGPAFYTKLIFFLNRNPASLGFIMDQWTVKSIQLLTGKAQPHITKSGWVQDKNTSAVYDEFCRTIENLASELGIESHQAEEKLFSLGGGKAAAWRRYVAANWRHN